MKKETWRTTAAGTVVVERSKIYRMWRIRREASNRGWLTRRESDKGDLHGDDIEDDVMPRTADDRGIPLTLRHDVLQSNCIQLSGSKDCQRSCWLG